jgi:hypothetical protein
MSILCVRRRRITLSRAGQMHFICSLGMYRPFVRPSVRAYKKTRTHGSMSTFLSIDEQHGKTYTDCETRIGRELFRTSSPVIRNALILDSACLLTGENCLKIVYHDIISSLCTFTVRCASLGVYEKTREIQGRCKCA